MKIEIDFICATIDETKNLKKFVDSFISNTEHPQFYLKLIIIDQFPYNREAFFKKNKEKIIYIHSKKRGLSYNRNIGLEFSKSEIYSFIDSDCLIDKNYLAVLYKILIKTKNYEYISIYGKINSIENNEGILKKWPRNDKYLTKTEVWRLSTSVNIVYKTKNFKLRFDEELGLGTNFGSCEDIDYALRTPGYKFYSHKLITYHPSQNFFENTNNKIYSYGLGFGALCRKHLYFTGFLILIAGIFKKSIEPFMSKTTFQQSYISIKSRIIGFLLYEQK